MTKTRETWNREVLSAAKLNQASIDYARAGVMVWSDASVRADTNPWYHRPYPYNADKSVHDRLRIMAGSTNAAIIPSYSLDNGGTWLPVTGAGSLPISLHPFYVALYNDAVDLDGIAGTVWLRLRWAIGFTPAWCCAFAFLYNSDYDPF